jgi:hypothetical protein
MHRAHHHAIAERHASKLKRCEQAGEIVHWVTFNGIAEPGIPRGQSPAGIRR